MTAAVRPIRLASVAALLLIAACSPLHKRAATPPPAPLQTVAIWATSADGTRRLERGADLPLVAAGAADAGETVTVDADRQFQSMVGFGAAMTDASADLIEHTLPPTSRVRLIDELFGSDGLGIAFLRVPIGASDFSSRHYSLDDMPKGESDPALAHFAFTRETDTQVAALSAARAANPELALMASPWSAPGWMKDSDSLIKGQLKPAAYPAFAAYFSRYLGEMAVRGLPVGWISIQNEPDFEPADYPGMRFPPAARAQFVGKYLGPLLEARGQTTKILDWDHNWDQPQNPMAVLADPDAARYVSGVAWHCYGGEVEAMGKVHASHPDKEVFFTECSGGDWASDWAETLGWMTDKLVISATRMGSRGTLLWNLALDERHGPHLGGCGDCRAVVTIDRATGAITRNVEYYVLGHASRFVKPGARRVSSSADGSVADVAFRNVDGTLVMIAHNRADREVALTVVERGRAFHAVLPAGEVVTFVWNEQASAP
jgi:glucosylceramidase